MCTHNSIYMQPHMYVYIYINMYLISSCIFMYVTSTTKPTTSTCTTISMGLVSHALTHLKQYYSYIVLVLTFQKPTLAPDVAD